MSIFSKWFGSKDNEEQKKEIAEEVYFNEDEPIIFDDPAPTEVHFNESISVQKTKNEKKSSEPNNLLEAIQYVVVNRGRDYIQDRGFINILSDFQVFKEFPAAKHIFLNMQANGYIGKILQASNWGIESKAIAAKYSTVFGAKEDIVLYLVQCIGYSLGYSTVIPLYTDKYETPTEVFDDPSDQTTINSPKLNNPKPFINSQSQVISPVMDDTEPYDPKCDLENYQYPTLDLLRKYNIDHKPYIDIAEQTAYKDRILQVLRTFGVEITRIKATVGPTITLYEITPAPGVRISKIKNMEDDIALSLAALGIRIIAPIPGKGTVGIEIPNVKPSIVSMESILNTHQFQESKMHLPCAIGKAITNEVFMFDLAKAPHLLVAGATGQGKSVCLNAILTSLLYKKHPTELQLVLIDTKQLEFSIYQGLNNHFLAALPDGKPIVTDVPSAIRTLTSLCKLIDARLDLLKEAGTRNISDYNRKFINRGIYPRGGHGYMPYIVLMIEEYGELIMESGKEAEALLLRIAKLGHLVGIHMIITTRRFSTKIITDSLKYEIPARIAFRVTINADSKLILGMTGAQQLIGRGDMLFLNVFSNELYPIRLQCAYVDTLDVERIVDFVSNQQGYSSPYELPSPDYSSDNKDDKDVDMQHLDPLFEDAARLVVREQLGSTGLVQRKFAIGYNRAGRLLDQLEKAGVVGAAIGSKPREVMIQDEYSLNKLLASLR